MSKFHSLRTSGYILGAGTFLFCLMPGTAMAGPLFKEQATVRTAKPAHISVSRYVTIDRRAMQQPQLTFDLFGEQVTAVRDRIEHHKAGQTVWVGHIAGNLGETVVLTAHGSTFAGVIHHKTGVFEITGDGRGAQTFNRLELSALPPEDLEGIPDGGGITDHPTTEGETNILGDLTQQDLLVAYTQQACTAVGGAGDTNCDQIQANIATAVSDLNAAYAASGIDISMNLVATALTPYNEAGKSASTALNELRITNDGQMDELHPLRDSAGADLVALIYAGPGCGIGYSPSSPSSAFSVTLYSCMVGNRTMAHELGHNQGALHDRAQHGGGTTGAYNYGFRRCNDGSTENLGSPYFRTVMSYSCSGAPRVGRFSNPNVTYLGVPQGVDPLVDPNKGAWNARTLNESAAYVAGFRDAPAPPTPPDAPSALVAAASGSDAIDLSWSDNADNEDSFQLQSSTDGTNWTTIATLGANTEYFGDSGLIPETEYFYRINAVNGAGTSAFSTTASATTGAPPGPPVLDLALDETTVSGVSSGSYVDTHADDDIVQTVTEALPPGKDRSRKRTFSHIWNFDVAGGPGDVMATANAWVSGSEGAVFEYSPDGGNAWIMMFTVTGTPPSTLNSFPFPDGFSGPVQIRARDAALTPNEPVDTLHVDSLTFSSSSTSGSAPAAPNVLSITGSTASSASLSFTDNATDEFGFEIWRSATEATNCNDGEAIADLSANPDTGIVSYTDEALGAGQTYWYFVKAFNGAGDGGQCSNIVSVTTDTIADIVASGTGYKVAGIQHADLSWSGATTDLVDVYRAGTVIAQPVNTGVYTDNIGVTGSASYRYMICEAGSVTICSEEFLVSIRDENEGDADLVTALDPQGQTLRRPFQLDTLRPTRRLSELSRHRR